MKNNITHLEIKNFKSLRDVKIDCKRINVFIGEPNVGKSNILEALSLYMTPNCSYNIPFQKEYIRYEKLSNLFYDQDRKNTISVESNIGVAYFNYLLNSNNIYEIILGEDKSIWEVAYPSNQEKIMALSNIRGYIQQTRHNTLPYVSGPIRAFVAHVSDGDQGFNPDDGRYPTVVKRYIFESLVSHKNPASAFLNPPYGDNLYAILENNPKIYEEATHFFSKYGLDLLIDTESNKLDVQKRVGNRVYKIPYSLAADTLQRIIFHLAAIETNNDSVLLFEEPEAHAFPKYISLFANKVIVNKENQFFIATHSQYLLTPFIEQCPQEDLAIFICTYEDYETKVRALSKKEIANIMETGIDLFYNLSAFEK
jgi:AAA15 family ATPase/GTPase